MFYFETLFSTKKAAKILMHKNFGGATPTGKQLFLFSNF